MTSSAKIGSGPQALAGSEDQHSPVRAAHSSTDEKRAAFWRSLGFPNLVLARAARARQREERLKRARFERARALNPFAIPDDCDYLLELDSHP